MSHTVKGAGILHSFSVGFGFRFGQDTGRRSHVLQLEVLSVDMDKDGST